ncbi:MAG TPA: response regulator [Gemmataceae bacterium]|jgi:signal transduction histidine kinase
MPDEKVDILIVDDLPEKVLVYRAILDELGENLVVARTGAEALSEVLRREFAVILMDVYMPGMDGLETAALIRQRKKSAHTPIIFVTAFADEVRAAQGYAHGAVDYILTPVIPEVLRAKVKVFVDLFRMTRQVKRQAEERVALAEERSKRAAAEEANRRSNFLADVSRALAASLDPDTTARTLARQAVPFLADLAGVTLAGDHGQPWRTELAWVTPPGREVRRLRLTSPDGPRDELRDAVDRALDRGEAEVLDGLDISYPSPADCPAPPDCRVRSAAVVPLRARGRTLGVLTLAYGPSGRAHKPDDLTLVEDLASRAAIALDNARLYEDVQQADRQKNEFLSMLAHELRNPLAPIRNAVAVLRATGTDPSALNWAGGVIDRQVRHLVRLVDDLLDISRITRGKIRLRPEPVDVAAVVAQAVEASRPEIEARRHRLEVSVTQQPLWVNGDPARLAQVLTNLLNNAAKYTEPGGRVWLTADAACAEKDPARPLGLAVLSVRDTGIGIPPDMLPRVFDLFTQGDHSLDRSEGGLGIGLTLVRRLVELHGGTVTAASDGPGRGSEFTVRLPLADRAESAGGNGADGPYAAEAPPHGLRVLVVDDNVDGAESLARLLRLGGHEVRLAHDGPAALTTAGEFRPEAVVLDIGLPGMDGFQVARRLRDAADTKGAVIVAVTGYGREEDRVRSREAGFDHHLVKPVDVDTLCDLLAAASRSLSNGAAAAPTSVAAAARKS